MPTITRPEDNARLGALADRTGRARIPAMSSEEQSVMAQAGSSGTPLLRKLGIREGSRVLLVGAPDRFGDVLGALPLGAELIDDDGGDIDVALLFVLRAEALEEEFGALAARMRPNGGLWVAYPKKAARVATDVTFDVVQAWGLGAGLVDNKVCAIDETWTGLRFVRRRKER
jgi:hypothetical protein